MTTVDRTSAARLTTGQRIYVAPYPGRPRLDAPLTVVRPSEIRKKSWVATVESVRRKTVNDYRGRPMTTIYIVTDLGALDLLPQVMIGLAPDPEPTP